VLEAGPPSLIGSNLARILVALGFAGLAGGLAMFLREKQRAVRATAEQRGLIARPLVPSAAVPFAFGIVTAAALAILLWSSPIAGALLVALAMALASHRAAIAPARSRGPGAWNTASDPATLLAPRPEALPTDALDVATWRGKLTFFAVAVVVAGLSFALRHHIPQIAIALPLVSAAVVPIFVSGTRTQLPETPLEVAMRILRPTRDALAKRIDLAHVDVHTIARTPEGETAVDEVRLACIPRDPTPGLRAIELAIASSGPAAIPEVIVRYDGGSPAADRIAGGSLGPGHSPEERTMRFTPDEPTAGAAAALIAHLLLALEERRSRRIRFRGLDRRRSHALRGAFVVERAT
jgi:hypothetical protein